MRLTRRELDYARINYARTWGRLPAAITLGGLCGRRRGNLILRHEAAAPDHSRDSLDRGRGPDDLCAGDEPRRDYQGPAHPDRPRDRGGRHRPLLSLVLFSGRGPGDRENPRGGGARG